MIACFIGLRELRTLTRCRGILFPKMGFLTLVGEDELSIHKFMTEIVVDVCGLFVPPNLELIWTTLTFLSGASPYGLPCGAMIAYLA